MSLTSFMMTQEEGRARAFHVAYAQLDYDKLIIALVLGLVLVFILGVSFSDLRYGEWE